MNKLLLFCLFTVCTYSQKSAYIPAYILDPNTPEGAQFSWEKTTQSENFTLIWGNTVGADPATYNDIPNLNFDPSYILETMEFIYSSYKDFGFIDDSEGTNLHEYKIPIIMLGTWGADVAQGFAFGGDADGIVGAFWVHPVAMQTGDVAAHELAHSIQAQITIDYRTTNGFGPVWNYTGLFWETHANFMRELLYPQDVSAWGMDVYHCETLCDWKNAYTGDAYLHAIMESDGIEMVNNLWKQSLSDEYPIEAYKRLGNYNQQQFNDRMYEYARRMATYDFEYNNVGSYFRQYRAADLVNYLPSVQATYTILKPIAGSTTRYEVPIEIAPEEYAYNVIPLYSDNSGCAVIVKFKGHTEVNQHTGWRYGFVAEHLDGTISRYSPTYAADTSEIGFQLEGDEVNMYLVVMGAPSDEIQVNPDNDTWKGYPKHFRYPYELTILGAKPEGYQLASVFRAQVKVDGHIHSNGGGWVQNSATVANSVFISPTSIVLGNANLSGNVRLENTALVSNATLSGSVRVIDNAFINGGNYSGNAVISDQSFAENVTMSQDAKLTMRAKVTNYDLSGNIEVGGDVVVYNEAGECDNGVYYVMTNYYEDNLLQCDNRTASHPANSDVNATYNQFTSLQMAMNCNCDNYPQCTELSIANNVQTTFSIFPNPATSDIIVSGNKSFDSIELYDALGKMVLKREMSQSIASYELNIGNLSAGIYVVKVISGADVEVQKMVKK